MTKTQWAARAKGWGGSGAPLSPNQEVIDYLYTQISPDSNLLLLGVTTQIHQAYNHITAVDQESVMIENVWLGNTATKQAILGNWLTVDLPAESFDAVYGDGSINMLPTDQDRITVIDRCRFWLKPGGKIVLRMFCRPEKPVTREWLQQEVKTPTVNWTAFRRLVPMALLGETGGNQIQWRECYKYFNELFPDRTQLPYTPEQIARMDAYQDVDTSTWFPTRTEIQQLWPATEFVDVGTYDIANLCPIMILKN